MLPRQSWLIEALRPVLTGTNNPLHTAMLLLALVLLEAVLSADNAVALASLVQHIEPHNERERILNLGLIMALVLRAIAVVAAGLVVHQPVLRFLGGAYLVWLALAHFQAELSDDVGPQTRSFFSPQRGALMILLVAATDLAFSLDSVSAAVVVTDQFVLVVVAGGIGLLMLRWMAGLMLVWMERFPNLQNAGYLTVLAVGLRLVGQVVAPALVPSEPMLLILVLLLFVWGFVQTQASEP
jgi:YkoY family integral membrane protein